MIATLGDLVDDVVVHVDNPINVASDTAARIVRRRGGSAANVASAVAALGHAARFIGQVGDDPIGAALVADLAEAGVDAMFVRRGGRTGTIVVLVDRTGERTMLTDRGACTLLDQPSPECLDGVSTLHVPMYSVVIDPLAATARTMIGWARERSIDVSVDVSSVAVIDELGAAGVHDLLGELRPTVVFANDDEARALDVAGPIGGAVTVVKRGAAPAAVFSQANVHEVAARPIEAADTTGAGDAFAAGFLTSDWRSDVVAACRSGHEAAAITLTGPRR